ncbi:MAG: ABC transporter ATP-binding protein [Spirochaetales bacterium]|nr:ABC transporter ATP-binding protein [Candidatus Physcosoma equi]
MSILSLKDVSAGYGRREVIHSLSLSLEKGEFCAFLGLNGSGKTTLLKVMEGLIPLWSGSVEVDGTEVTKLDEKRRARLLSLIPQRSSIITGRTVMDVVLMGANPWLGLLDSPGRRFQMEAEAALEKLGIQSLKDKDYSILSGGQQQLVILARSMVQNAPVMLMDEPDSALDYVNRHMVLQKIRELTEESGKCCLITLHDPNFALSYCSRIVAIKDGDILWNLETRKTRKETLEDALSGIYGEVRLLENDGEYVMVGKRTGSQRPVN